MTTPPRARHRAPPLWVRLNESSPLRVVLTAGVGLLILGSLIGIADDMGDDFTPRARADVVALPSRAEEPTGRGGPVAPIFADVDAPQYQPEPVPPVSTPQGQVTATPRRVAVAASAPRSAASPPAGNPVTPEPAPVPPVPAEPEPVVGLPVIEAAEPAPVIEEEPPVTETPPVTPPLAEEAP